MHPEVPGARMNSFDRRIWNSSFIRPASLTDIPGFPNNHSYKVPPETLGSIFDTPPGDGRRDKSRARTTRGFPNHPGVAKGRGGLLASDVCLTEACRARLSVGLTLFHRAFSTS